MSTKWEKLEGNEGLLTIEVSAEEVNKGIDAAFKKVVTKINAPGFRKGKMPRQIFDKQYGAESLYQDALDILLPVAYGKALEEAGVEPVSFPDIDVKQMGKGEVLIFTAKITVKPEVKLGEYKNLEVEVMATTVSDEEVQAELVSLQERHADLVVKEEGTVENGDTVVIDFEGYVDGVAFEGGTGENYSLTIGSGTFIPGFEEQLIGLSMGDKKDVEVSFPEEYHAEDLAGKPATFKTTIHEVKSKELPALDDEFAKDADEEVESLEELTTKLRTNLENGKKGQAEGALRDALIEKAAANAEVDIPSAMIDTELETMMKEFEQRLEGQGMNLELYFQFTGSDANALKEQMKEDAAKRVRINLTLEAIIVAENIVVSEEDVDAEIEKMAASYNMDAAEIKKMLGNNMDRLNDDLKFRKAIELLVENNKTVA